MAGLLQDCYSHSPVFAQRRVREHRRLYSHAPFVLDVSSWGICCAYPNMAVVLQAGLSALRSFLVMLFIVIAIASVNSWSIKLHYSCPNNTNHTADVSTFSLSDALIPDCRNSTSTLWSSDDSAGGSAGFFYFVNVAALVYVLLITFTYVMLWPMYESEKRIALGDLGITALFFVLFFFCSASWWAGSNTLGYATGDERITALMKDNENFWKNAADNSLSLIRNTSNGKLVISVLCDWVCVFTFAMNCWFVWKEVVPKQPQNPSQIA